MLFRYLLFVLTWLSGLVPTTTGRSTSLMGNAKRDVYTNSTTLDKSWTDAKLFSFSAGQSAKGVAVTIQTEVICKTCYIKGTATTQLTIAGNQNISQAINNFTSQVKGDVKNVTTGVINFFETEANALWTSFAAGDFDVDFPTLPFDFNINVPKIPESQLNLLFDGLELYMLFDTKLTGATITLNLFTSQTSIGVSDGKGNDLGIILSVDIIFSASTEIDIGSGFHIKLNDGVLVDLAMFGKNISSVTMNGGHFEFLPVTFSTSGNFQLSAVLRVGVRAGISVAPPVLALSSGAEVGVYANIAEFTTNVTTGTGTCAHIVEEVYSMAIGVQAGATLAIGDNGWGPTPNTSTVIFYTTLSSTCLTTTLPSTTVALSARAAATTGLTTTTISSKFTYTATGCISTGLVNCPVSLQTTSKTTLTSTIVTAVPSGSKATFPVTVHNSVASVVAFGSNSKALVSSSGAPTSYNPSAPTNEIQKIVNGHTGGVNNKLIIGLSVGLGIPVLVGLIAACFFLIKFHKSRSEKQRDEVAATSYTYTYPAGVRVPTPPPYGPYEPSSPPSMSMLAKKAPDVTVTERFANR